MPIESLSTANGNLVFKISGALNPEELAQGQQEMARAIRMHGRIRVLFVAVEFQGWTRSPQWGADLDFQVENDARIDRMAIVGDRRWEELALLFTSKGVRPFPIEYFGPTELAEARAWMEDRGG